MNLNFKHCVYFVFFLIGGVGLLGGCASTDIVESPKTAFASESGEAKEPQVIWTSRTMTRKFDYLGQVKSRSFTYAGALKRVVAGAKELRADAVIDLHYRAVGFMNEMQAFAIKFK